MSNGTRLSGARIFSLLLAVFLALGLLTGMRPIEPTGDDPVTDEPVPLPTATVSFYAEEDMLYTEIQVPLGFSADRAFPSPPRKTGCEFLGWTTSPGRTDPNFTAESVVRGDLAVHAIWRIPIVVEHYLYATSTERGKLQNTDRLTAFAGDVVTVDVRAYPDYVFDQQASQMEPELIGGTYTIRLYYRRGAYGLKVLPQLELEAEDCSPREKKLSLDQFARLVSARTINKDSGAVLDKVEFASLTSPDFDKLDLSATSSRFAQQVTLVATWANGDTDSSVVQIRVADSKPPALTVLHRRLVFPAGSAPMSEQQLIRAFSASAKDTLDGLVQVQTDCLGAGSVSGINWSAPGEYVLYFTAADQNRNQSRRACIVAVE